MTTEIPQIPAPEPEEHDFWSDWEAPRETKAPPNPPKPPEQLEARNTPGQEANAGSGPQAGEKPTVKMPVEASAGVAINMIDTGQQMGFGFWAGQKLKNKFTPEEIAECGALAHRLAEKELKWKELEEDQYEMLFAYQSLKNVVEDLPFSDGEKKALQKPMEEVIRQNNYDIPPWMGLTVALVQALGSRAMGVYRS
jgi:hypothetical protein